LETGENQHPNFDDDLLIIAAVQQLYVRSQAKSFGTL